MRVSMLKIYIIFLGKMVLSLPGGRNWGQKGHARKKGRSRVLRLKQIIRETKPTKHVIIFLLYIFS